MAACAPAVTHDELVQLVRSRAQAKSGKARRIRELVNVSQREMAAAVGVNTSTLARWERGECVPRDAAALRWARALEQLKREARR
jgi:DNA-binding transcriptional regulator YiaG